MVKKNCEEEEIAIKQLEVPVDKNEPGRLSALKRTKLLDTDENDETFDRFTAMAARTFQVPVAIVSLVDSKRQWFKSGVGVPVNSTHRNHAFCNYTVLQQSSLIFIVPDATLDERFAENPLVVGPLHIRFYAGAALIFEGQKIGSFCIIDSKPNHDFTVKQQELLLAIADMVASLMVERRERQLAADREASKLNLAIMHTIQPTLIEVNDTYQQVVSLSANASKIEAIKKAALNLQDQVEILQASLEVSLRFGMAMIGQNSSGQAVPSSSSCSSNSHSNNFYPAKELWRQLQKLSHIQNLQQVDKQAAELSKQAADIEQQATGQTVSCSMARKLHWLPYEADDDDDGEQGQSTKVSCEISLEIIAALLGYIVLKNKAHCEMMEVNFAHTMAPSSGQASSTVRYPGVMQFDVFCIKASSSSKEAAIIAEEDKPIAADSSVQMLAHHSQHKQGSSSSLQGVNIIHELVRSYRGYFQHLTNPMTEDVTFRLTFPAQFEATLSNKVNEHGEGAACHEGKAAKEEGEDSDDEVEEEEEEEDYGEQTEEADKDKKAAIVFVREAELISSNTSTKQPKKMKRKSMEQQDQHSVTTTTNSSRSNETSSMNSMDYSSEPGQAALPAASSSSSSPCPSPAAVAHSRWSYSNNRVHPFSVDRQVEQQGNSQKMQSKMDPSLIPARINTTTCSDEEEEEEKEGKCDDNNKQNIQNNNNTNTANNSNTNNNAYRPSFHSTSPSSATSSPTNYNNHNNNNHDNNTHHNNNHNNNNNNNTISASSSAEETSSAKSATSGSGSKKNSSSSSPPSSLLRSSIVGQFLTNLLSPSSNKVQPMMTANNSDNGLGNNSNNSNNSNIVC